MKRIHYFILLAVSLTMLSAGILIGRVAASPMAATGCFPDTNGHWAEPFICWMAQNGIVGGFPNGTFQPDGVVTRAQAAVMIKRATEKGEFLVSVGPSGWVPVNNPTFGAIPTIDYSSNSANLGTTQINPKQFVASANAPTAIFGRYTRLKGAKLCYTASAQAQLAAVMVMKVGNENNGSGSPNSFISDTNLRTDENCRTYLISDPPNMTSGEHVAIALTVSFADTASKFKVSSVTFIFEPTSVENPQAVSGIAPPEDAQQPIMPLSEFPEWFGLDKGE